MPIALSGEEQPYPMIDTRMAAYWNLMTPYVLGSGVFRADSQTATDHLHYMQQHGSLVMGLLAAYFAFKGDASQHWRLFFTTGILGGYTTFSAFSLDVALHYERGELGLTALYIVLSVALSIGGLFAGLALVRHFS